MRLLICANSFFPAVGGYERVALTIAEQLSSKGHAVRIITFTPGTDDADRRFPFEIYRNPRVVTILKLLRWSEIYIQNNVSFRLLWPLLFCWRPLVCVHHGFYSSSRDMRLSLNAWLKHLVTLISTNISVSKAVADELPGKSFVVTNPYRDDVFFRVSSIEKNRDLFFVGRLVSDKGLDLLVEALAILRDRGIQTHLTIAGKGPEQSAIHKAVREMHLEHLITFVGQITDSELNEFLNKHRILVVPSRLGEGFGVVALEGIACGCVVVGSTFGGLPEAIGNCGRTFPTDDPSALADVLQELLAAPNSWTKFRTCAKAHLDAHRPSLKAEEYAKILTQVLSR
jgi:glycogen synthase